MKIRSKVEIVIFRLIGYRDGNNNSRESMPCQKTNYVVMKVPYKYSQGRRHEFSIGGTDSDWEGERIQVNQNHLPPNSDFSSDFGHFILGTLENLKVLTNIQKLVFKNREFWGGYPTGILKVGIRARHPPPR